MVEPRRIWELLANDPHLAGVEREWRDWLGGEWSLVKPYLTVDAQPVGVFPCDTWEGDECPRRVVHHNDGSIVAVCGNTPVLCKRLSLSKADITVHRFDLRRFARAVAVALGVDNPNADAVDRLPRVWLIGTVRLKARARMPVYFVTAPTDGDLATVGESLVGRHAKSGVVLVTASIARPAAWERPLAERASHLVALPEMVRWTAARLTPMDPVRPTLQSWLEHQAHAENTARVASPKPMGRPRNVESPDAKRVVALWRTGASSAEIVRETGLSKVDVDRMIDTARRRPENRDARRSRPRRKK